MSTCDHRAKFHIKQTFTRLPDYSCKKCGAPLVMSKGLKTLMQVINIVFILVMLGAAFSTGILGPGIVGFMRYVLVMVGVLALYVIISALAISFGRFEEVIPKEPEAASADMTDGSGNNQTSTGSTMPEDTSGYTKEQLDLMALYDSYAKKNETKAANSAEAPRLTVNLTPPKKISETSVVNKEDCIHKPLMTWRCFLPGNPVYICEHCEQPIDIQEDRKRILNIILLVFSIIVLAASVTYSGIQLWQLALISLGILIVACIIQFIFVKTSRFELKKDK